MSPSADHSGRRLGLQGQSEPHPGPHVSPAPAPGSRGAVVDWALYVGGERRTVSTYAEAVRLVRQGGGFV